MNIIEKFKKIFKNLGKVKIAILIVVIIVSSIGGFLIYSNHMTTNFENSLKEAYEYATEKKDTTDTISANSRLRWSNQVDGVKIISNMIKDFDKALKSLDNEINSLEEAKKYVQTPTEKKYIDLQLKLKNNYREQLKLHKKMA